MNKWFKLFVSAFCILWITKNGVLPVAGYFWFKSEFITQTNKCSNAMDESWFIEQSGNKALINTTKIHLLDCHEYDKTRKIMLTLGVPETVLAYLGLIAVELHPRSATELSEPHRFTSR
jgi:His-Xaa-Ser system protein (TIGR03982 family)